MEKHNLEHMFKGWFIGNFEPTLFNTDAVEVAVKKYQAGAVEAAHYHKVSTEFTVIVSGEVRMKQQFFASGDIVRIEPGEITDFAALTDTVTVVVKIPASQNDKYLVDEHS
jgi:mannose-6-phosphate isomerase-like protein (cupin superfamily)